MAFRFDKLTIKAQEAVTAAQGLAADRGNPEIDPLHLLAALLEEGDGVVIPILDQIGTKTAQLRTMVDTELGHFPKASGGVPPHPGSSLGQVLEEAQREADRMKDDYVSTEHLFLALAKVDSKAKRILDLNAIEESDILKALKRIRGSAR